MCNNFGIIPKISEDLRFVFPTSMILSLAQFLFFCSCFQCVDFGVHHSAHFSKHYLVEPLYLGIKTRLTLSFFFSLMAFTWFSWMTSTLLFEFPSSETSRYFQDLLDSMLPNIGANSYFVFSLRFHFFFTSNRLLKSSSYWPCWFYRYFPRNANLLKIDPIFEENSLQKALFSLLKSYSFSGWF